MIESQNESKKWLLRFCEKIKNDCQKIIHTPKVVAIVEFLEPEEFCWEPIAFRLKSPSFRLSVILCWIRAPCMENNLDNSSRLRFGKAFRRMSIPDSELDDDITL